MLMAATLLDLNKLCTAVGISLRYFYGVKLDLQVITHSKRVSIQKQIELKTF
jgi:hypothetical protein